MCNTIQMLSLNTIMFEMATFQASSKCKGKFMLIMAAKSKK